MKDLKIKPDSQLGTLMSHFLGGGFVSHEIAYSLGIGRLAQRMQDLKNKFLDADEENPLRTKTIETGGKKKFSVYWLRNQGCEYDKTDWREF